ncbi:MAG: DNA-processing protein DprA [Lentisphaeria bacterium]|nr:DNA-processing protein DprA [Lentisphaeria bacterium]
MNENLAYFILNLIPKIGPITVKKLLTVFPTAVDILQATRSELIEIQGIGPTHANHITAWQTETNYEEELRRCEEAGIELVSPVHPDYPQLLLETYDPPLCLYVRGNTKILNGNNIAFVGSRKTSFYGVEVTKDLARCAKFEDWTVVSGLARGIDTVAHQTVVDHGGITIAVIGSGLARLYPKENLQLARDIVENGGAIISEFPLNAPPARTSFPMRNRIIAGMSKGTLVVEGGIKSGSMITATQAIEQGKLVFAVPGLINNPQAQGCHKLIKNGAKLVESFRDISEEFQMQPHLRFEVDGKEINNGKCIQIPLNSLEKKIVGVMERGLKPMTVDEISEHIEIEMGKMLSTIMVLEMKNVIIQVSGMRFALT